MKVKIGPYNTWIGPYQLANMVPFLSEDNQYKLGEWLSNTWVDVFCNWLYEKKSRKVSIHIDEYDTWNMDHTLSLIILPMLKKLKENKHSSPIVDDEDVPENMRYTLKKHEYDFETDDRWDHYKWEWVLNEMIWAFEHIVDDDWEYVVPHKKFLEINDRIKNGLRLFGKYYRSLWT